MSNDGGTGAKKPGSGWFSGGLLAVILPVINAAILFGVIWPAGDGVDSGLGVAALIITFTLPVMVVTIVTGIVGVTKRRGRAPGAIALIITSGVLLWGIWGFVSIQMF